MSDILRIANCSGFYGDRFSAAREMVEGGDIDVLTGDYLAELTMFILSKAEAAGRPGYAVTFLQQMKEVLVMCVERGIKIVANAGGLDPKGLAAELTTLAASLGVTPRIAYVTGDDLRSEIPLLREAGHDFRNLDTGEALKSAGADPFTANAYLGGRGIALALSQGADIVVCPRVTDASLVVGPCMWKFGWDEGDFDELAGAVAAGHIIECGAQATGGNYAFFDETDTTSLPGFPIAEMRSDGSSTITKHEGTGGGVTVGTVTAQLLYEVGPPQYLNPDVTVHLDTVRLEQEAPNRVTVSGCRGTAPSDHLKVAMTTLGPYTQSVVFAMPGGRLDAKIEMLKHGLEATFGGLEQFDAVRYHLARHDQPDASLNELAVAELTVTFASSDQNLLGRRIFNAATALALSTYPGIYFPGTRQMKPSQTGVNWPCLIPAELVTETVVMDDGRELTVPPRRTTDLDAASSRPASVTVGEVQSGRSTGPTSTVTLGTVFGTRSGDKGAHANVGIWARTPEAHAWLREHLTVEAFRELMPEAAYLHVIRADLPNLLALNFVIEGILGSGAAAMGRFDPQAKGLGEFIRGRRIDLPAALVTPAHELVGSA
jgi:hypothetical protein